MPKITGQGLLGNQDKVHMLFIAWNWEKGWKWEEVETVVKVIL